MPGELFIGGAGVTLGYLARPELTAERFVADPFAGGGARMYRTGDLGRWRADGALECLGRTDHQVKIRGYRIELGEIEAALVAHPGVRQAVVMAREDRPGDVRLVAYVVPRGEAVEAQALREQLQRTLPEYMIPAHFVPVAALPLLPNGNIARRALPAPVVGAPAAHRELVAPAGPTQLRVAEAFQDLLAIPRIGVNDNFFLLGGHSLLAAQAAARLGRAFGRTIPMRVLFEAPTVARLAAWLDGGIKAEARAAPAVIPRRADASWAPLSLMQQRVWFVEELNPGRSVYNVPSTHRLRGKLDEGAFARAFAELLARQSSLRTIVGMQGETPVERVLPEVAVSLFPAEDLSSLPEAEREATLRAKVTADIARPFVLTEGPLFLAKMYQLGPEEHAFFFMVHHIVWDGWSFDLLYDEMAALYSAFSAGKPSPLAALPVSYGDFAAWQREFMQGPELGRQVAHWKKHLAGALEPLALPTDFPRPREASERGGIEWLRVPLEEAERVRALGQSVEATSFMVLLALYYVLLARLSGQRDLVVGTPVRGRSLPEVENVMGFFVNALPLRLAVDPDAPFIELLERVRELVLDAFAAEDVPFEHLVYELQAPRDASRSPIFQTFFSYQDVRGRSLDWGNLRHDRIPVSQPGLAQDLSLWFVERPDGLLGGLNYALDLFTVETARTINARYLTLLRGALADPQASVADLPLVTTAERDRVAAWSDTGADYPRDRRVEALVEEQARRTPDRPAIVSGEAAISHGALDARANRLARCLRRRGVGRGTLVGVALERSIDMVASVLAVLKAGGTYVPLDPAYPPARLALMVEDSGMKVLVASHAVAASLGFVPAATLAPDDDAAEIESESAEAPPALAEAASVEDAAYVIYTSGSTGKPKGVRLPHRAVVNFLASMRGRPGLTPQDRLLAVTTLSFDIAVLELLLPLTVGAEIVLASRDDAMDGHALRALAEGRGATVMQATPATWRMLIEAGWSGAPRFKALCGGEPLPADLADALLERAGEVWNMYGPTETTVWSTCWRVERERSGIWIGEPIGNTQVWILDEQLRPCPIGVPGEIYIGGEGVALGYLDRPELTAERFVADPFAGGGARMYRTGDLGRWRPDGQLECLGRTDFQVKVRGHRIELGEIEAALAAHPTVRQAVAMAREDRPGDVRLVAYIVPRGEAVEAQVLREHLQRTLPEYMVPAHFVTLDELPLLPNGKINRRALPAPTGEALLAESELIPPAGATQVQVAEIFQTLLAVPRVGANDSFFLLGGHSLLAAQAAARLGRAFGRTIPIRVLFDAPTVARLASWLDGETKVEARPAPAVIPRRADPSWAPLSLMQQRVWFVEELNPGRGVYNISSARRLHGKLDGEVFARAFAALLGRQSSLRTVIGMREDTPVQRVLPEVAVSLFPAEDLSSLPEAEREATLRAKLDEQIARPFALTEGPLFRVKMYQLGPEEHAFFFMVHHLVWDGWSFELFHKEMSALYGAFRAGRPSPLAPLPVSYGDFAAWQREFMQGPELGRQVAHWKKHLAGSLEPLALPTDFARPREASERGGLEWLRVPLEEAERIRSLGQSVEATPFMVLLALYYVLLARLSGQRDVIVGTPVRGRSLPEVENVMGFFANALPLRLTIDPTASFIELLRQVRELVLDAFAAEDVPFEHLVRELKVPHDTSRSPIFQTFFSYQDVRGRSLDWGNLRHDRIAVPQPGLAQDLTFWFAERPDGFLGGLNYALDLFIPETARMFNARYLTLLQGALADPQASVADLPLVTTAERERVAAWNDTVADYPRDRRVEALVEEQARRTPERLAIVCGEASITHGALEARANRLARCLRRRGVGRGTLVGIALERSIDMVASVLAVLKAGGTYVPLDPAYPPARLALMVEDSQMKVLVASRAVGAALGFGAAATLAPDDDAAEIESESAEAPPALDGPKATAEDAAYVIYTSGSTGKPKGVRLPHRAVVNFLVSMRGRPGLTGDDRLLAVTTLSFDIAVLELLLPLTVGAEIVLASRDDAMDGHALRALAEGRGATVMQATPATWRMLIEAGWSGAPGFKALCGGEPLPSDLADALLERSGEVWNMYGPTETTVWSTCWRVERERSGIWIGEPIGNTQVWILDEQLRVCPIGVPGEIYIGGDGVALGYLDRPELTAERFVADPFAGGGARMYRTGDLGRWRPDGELECLGRTDFQVKVRGHRIELGEIEAALAAHATVRQAVAMAREDRPGDVRLVAYVVPRGEAVEAEALREHLQRTLPEYMIPAHFVPLAELPLLPNGKIDRRALPAPTGEALLAESELIPPAGATQVQVAEIFQTLLAVPRVGANDNFFLLGGHSLLAAQAAARLGRAFGRTIPIRVLFDAPTVARLAAWLDGGTKAEARAAPAVIPHRADASWAPLSLMQQRVWFVEELNPGRGVYNIPSTQRLRGKLDETAFARAFAELLGRQGSLRTVIAMREGTPVQRVLPEVAVSLFPAEDLSSLPEAERETTLQAELMADIARPLLLSEGLLFRVKMYQLGPEEHAFFFMVHHLIWDGWSFDLLYDEMATLYGAFSAGKPSPLAPLSVSYGDFAAWQREFMQGPELGRQVAHWTKHLAGALEPLALPTDFPRPLEASERGGIEWLRVPLEEAERIRALGRSVEATPFMVLLALYYVLLARLSGQRDLVVGTPVRGRNLPEVENVMGFFANALPLRLAVDPDAPFIELLKRVRELVLDAFTAEEVPFEHLVHELKVPRDASRSTIFQTLFSYQDVRGRSLDWGNLRHDRIAVSQPGVAQDLSIWFVERADGFLGGLSYALDLFTAETARTINERYLTLLRGALANPQAAVRDLPLVAAAERESVAAWNDTAADYPRDRRVEALVEEQARRAPERPAIVCGEATISHGALEARANRLARCLRRRGVGRGTLVGVALERSIDMVASVLAVLKAGGTYVPLDPAYPPARLALMVEDSQMKVLVASRAMVASLGFAAVTLSPEEDAAEIDGERAEAPPALAEAASVEDAAYVIYTSGSTGKPKGVRLPHRAVVNFLVSMRGRPGLTAEDRLLAVTTLSFDIAVLELLLPLTVGAEIVLASRDEAMDGHALRALAEARRATVMQATPATWRMLIEAGWSGAPGFKALCGGEPLPSDLADALLERAGEVWNMYGPTETTVWSTCWRVGRERNGIWIGTPVANTQVWILDEQLGVCPIGVPGEIYIGGDGVALGYLDRPELTAERFVADPFAGGGARMYRTGDLGRWRPDGELECLGRTDFQVKVRGHRIELGEIEAALAAHVTVAQAVVAARAGVGSEKQLCAYVIARPGQVPTSSDLRRHLRLSLPDYMVPPTYVVLDAFPLTPNGKVDRRALPDPDTGALASGARADDSAPPETEMEQALASVWQEILKVSQIGVQDNFFDLGGHSLLVMRVIAEMEKQTGRRVGPRTFVFSSLGQVAAAYDEVGSVSPPPKAAPPSAKRGGLLSRLLKP